MSTSAQIKIILSSREELSFTARNEHGLMVNWVEPAGDGSWKTNYELGESRFSEILSLAKHDPRIAYEALTFVCAEICEKSGSACKYGFLHSMARWALSNAVGSEADLPKSDAVP